MCDGSETMAGSKDMAGSNWKDHLKSYYLAKLKFALFD